MQIIRLMHRMLHLVTCQMEEIKESHLGWESIYEPVNCLWKIVKEYNPIMHIPKRHKAIEEQVAPARIVPV